MAVTKRMLHLPPYISTSWENVIALHMEQDEDSDDPLLVVTLSGGVQICIPDLREEMVQDLFALHAQILTMSGAEASEEALKFTGDFHFARNPWEPREVLQMLMRHQPSLRDEPPMPQAIINKLQSIGQLLDRDILKRLKPPLEGCNCPFCQVHRAVLTDLYDDEVTAEELPTAPPEEVHSGEWVIQSEDQSTFTVFAEHAPQTRFRVCLSDTISCTCGLPNCDHVKAVLLT